MQALPRLDQPRWAYENTTTTNTSTGWDVRVDVWHYHVSHDEGYGTIDIDWRLSVTPDGTPVRLDMWGTNWFTGGHWDHYIAEFYDFEADPAFDDATFAMPPVCKGVAPRCACPWCRGFPGVFLGVISTACSSRAVGAALLPQPPQPPRRPACGAGCSWS